MIVELRQYALRPGKRDVLIDLFESEFIEAQEEAGMTLIGQFRDLDDPDRFIWLRGFADMEARRRSLEAFYGGPMWQAHGGAANATMIDSDDVLLLRPLEGVGALPSAEGGLPAAEGSGAGMVVGGVHRLTGADELSVWFGTRSAPLLEAAGLQVVFGLVTETAANTFPALPVREGERVLVWLAAARNTDAGDAALQRARTDPGLRLLFRSPLQMMRLQPTPRSRLHG